MRKKTYPTDMSRERFEQIRPLLEQARKRAKPRTVGLYEVIFPNGARCIPISPRGTNPTSQA